MTSLPEKLEAGKISKALKGILSKNDEVRSDSYRVLLHIFKENPKFLYPKYGYLTNLLDADNHFQRYISLNLLANLAEVDVKNNFQSVYE